MDHCRCGPGVRWCARADALFDVAGMHVLDVVREPERLVLTVESEADVGGCPTCGVVAVGHGRREHRVHDAPCFTVPTVVGVAQTDLALRRAGMPAADVLRDPPDGRTEGEADRPGGVLGHRCVGPRRTTVSALARHLGVDWHTLWGAVEVEATARVDDPARLDGVATLGVDEHIWRPSRLGTDRAVTSMVDLTRDEHGCLHARLLDVVPGPVRDRLRRLAAGADRGVRRRHRVGGAGPVPRLR